MLNPDNRHLFLQALRPPEGYTFDSGTGTTFTLDLFTLLITPLSLALFDRQSPEQALSDPISLLESLRRYANRLTIFCHAGNISLPKDAHPLLSYLEDMIVEVRPQRGGAFHPKLWLLRYVNEGHPVIFRLLNLSRNLTFDRSWDLMVHLEGELTNRKIGFKRNQPLSDFFKVLPNLSRKPVRQDILDRVNLLQDQVRRVAFRSPANFTENFSFHPFNISGYRSHKFSEPFEHLLVISPFLTNGFLEDIIQENRRHTLISRLDSIQEISPSTAQKFDQVFHLHEMAEQDPREEPIVLQGSDDNYTDAIASHELSGLHAKLFVCDYGWNSTWLIGSANATTAAFHKNVEFMIQLHGKKSKVGIDIILGKDNDRNSFRSLLQSYNPSPIVTPIDQNQKKAEELSNTVCDWLVSCNLNLEVNPNGDLYDIHLLAGSTPPAPPGAYTIHCRPISLNEANSISINHQAAGVDILFKQLSMIKITAFIGFQVSVQVSKVKHVNRFVLLLPINGLPEERDAAILSAVLSDKNQFLRYLRLILMDDAEIASTGGWNPKNTGTNSHSADLGEMETPLLEDLARALSRSNEPGGKIDRIADLVERLNQKEESRAIIPPEFYSLWQIILQARHEIHE